VSSLYQPSSPTINGHVRDDEKDGNVEGGLFINVYSKHRLFLWIL